MADEQPAAHEEDEQHRLFREALERKKAESHRDKGHAPGNRGVREAHNDKTQRTFRRKSGS